MDISYSQFTEQLEKGNIDSLEIVERQQLRGGFKTPLPAGRHMVGHFTALLPFEATDGWVAPIRAKGVDVGPKEGKQPFGGFLFTFLPSPFIPGLITSIL